MRYSQFYSPDSLFPIPYSRFPTPDSLLPIPCSLLPLLKYLTKLINAIVAIFRNYDLCI
ncbi:MULTISPECIES: hypothetical protein [unclassified Moorena]|uniref:hypothetical protein n=1 Tax=unclassified Moorena TaxID=2683338 RepID=UPI0013B9428B|nr:MULTISPECIES: hypothetical protein [unclassified Moorena]NEQ16488.1 hypothetical protein [Moorena sp. SIO3E2]NEP34350.1 hypothetical protein [Moorena sp. SIO3B2]NEQ04761.1 hypothetical protein [Moorena sp. SIO4E2]NER88750.1 hypothetical protein [Moorena sp. SIO3A2]NES40158.1 hypothetical protein [Moorena sp. SIO2C4]